MKYTIISTYPVKGSQNIGDALIANSSINLIKSIKGPDHEFKLIWRASKWEEIKDEITESDAIIFACLAIRRNMDSVYPFLSNIMKTNIPIGILAAGTSLNMSNNSENIFSEFLNSDIQMLKELNKKAVFSTTRGYLSQSFCTYHGLHDVSFSGDIAFWDKRFSNRKFLKISRIRRIAISDPHNGKSYLKSIKLLYENLKVIFPEVQITVLLHGVNSGIENLCKQENIKIEKIYLNKDKGLDIYDSFDMHVGYRVHGHVSALSRRIPSYLIEQDGRGCDYGLTIEKKISVPGFNRGNIFNMRTVLQKLLDRKTELPKVIQLNQIYQILSLIETDAKSGFDKFKGLENQILSFNKLCSDAIKKLP